MKWCLKHTGIRSFKITIPIVDKWNVVKLVTKNTKVSQSISPEITIFKPLELLFLFLPNLFYTKEFQHANV